MLFGKKTEELSDQLAVYHEREFPRWGSSQYALKAGVSIEGFEGEGQLGNFSVSGCSMESVTYVDLTPNKEYQLKIIPAQDENMEPFSLKFILNWTKSSETLFQAGFSLGDGQSTAQLKKYAELLQARGIKPDYGQKKLGKS